MPKPTSQQLAQLVSRVSATIPHKPTLPPAPRATWKGLRVGDKLHHHLRPTEVVQVEACFSDGVLVRMVQPFKGVAVTHITEDTLSTLTKLKAPRKPRKRKEPDATQ